ncbi:hypothetical protein PS712_05622 [Pseudomonas fluorescens]|uniref:Uncharacterized protein n=1 Tax=Pseudomonas fluorescens TaxID=294 RepID=A0A5E7FGQ0_PSEFL|nr:hypothetical protein PS712_05622 [Pseudomonas fluorescens]
METNLYARHLVGKNFLTFGADDNGGERPGNRRPRGDDRWAIRNLVADAGETVLIVGGLIRQVVVVALMLHAEQEELAIVQRITIMIEVLGQFEGVTRQHGATVARTSERLALYLQCLQPVTHQRLALLGHSVAVMTEKIVNFVRWDFALIVDAAHVYPQRVSRLPVIECLDGHPARLQDPLAAPLGDRVGALSDRSTVVANKWLLR